KNLYKTLFIRLLLVIYSPVKISNPILAYVINSAELTIFTIILFSVPNTIKNLDKYSAINNIPPDSYNPITVLSSTSFPCSFTACNTNKTTNNSIIGMFTGENTLCKPPLIISILLISNSYTYPFSYPSLTITIYHTFFIIN